MYKMVLIFIFVLVFLLVGTAMARTPMDPIAGTPKASGFNLLAIKGGKVNLDDYQGKFILLNFWATWCAPCREEMPAMSNLHNQLSSSGLEVVGVHVGPSLAGVKKFLKAVPVDFTILLDKDMSLASWGVRGLPTTFLINPDGKLIYKAIGEREWDSPEMVKFLKKLIVSYERMASDDGSESESEIESEPEEAKSFLTSLMESMGWKFDTQDSKNQLLPN